MTDQQARAPRGWLGAGTAYVGIVFLIAFVLGVVRVMLVAPRLGPTGAVLLETPLILAVSWLASAWCVRTFRVPPAAVPRLAMAVFKANGGPCEIEVNATYLEELPYESYRFDRDEYRKMFKKPRKRRSA